MKTSYLHKSAAEVKAACEPLLSNTPITHFEYDRYYKKGSVFSLVTEQQHARWFTDYVGQNSLVNTAEHAITNIHKGLRHGLWSSYVPDLMSHMDGFLDVKEPISLLNDCGDYYEVNSFFASSQIENHRILDFYFSNIAFLRKFVIYFRESAANIINNGDKTYNRFPVETLPIYQPSSASSSTETINILPTIKITSYPLQNALNKQIPPRELECLLLLLKGRTYKEIARDLDISFRTVEGYFGNLKIKLNYTSRSDLFDKAYSLGLFDLIEW